MTERAQVEFVPIIPVLIIAIVLGAIVVWEVNDDLTGDEFCDDVLGEEWDPLRDHSDELRPRPTLCQHPNGTIADPWNHVENIKN